MMPSPQFCLKHNFLSKDHKIKGSHRTTFQFITEQKANTQRLEADRMLTAVVKHQRCQKLIIITTI